MRIVHTLGAGTRRVQIARQIVSEIDDDYDRHDEHNGEDNSNASIFNLTAFFKHAIFGQNTLRLPLAILKSFLSAWFSNSAIATLYIPRTFPIRFGLEVRTFYNQSFVTKFSFDVLMNSFKLRLSMRDSDFGKFRFENFE